MSRVSFTIMAGTVSACVGVSAFAVHPDQATLGSGKGPSVIQQEEARVTAQFAAQQQECETVKHRDYAQYEQCRHQAESTYENALRSAQAAAGKSGAGEGPGASEKEDKGVIEKVTEAVTGEETSERGSDEDTGMIEKVTQAVMAKLSELGIVSDKGDKGDRKQHQAAAQPQQGSQGHPQGQTSQQAFSQPGGQGMGTPGGQPGTSGQGTGAGATSWQGGQVGGGQVQQGYTQHQPQTQQQGFQGQGAPGSSQQQGFGQPSSGQGTGAGAQGMGPMTGQQQGGGASQQGVAGGGEAIPNFRRIDPQHFYEHRIDQDYAAELQLCQTLKNQNPQAYQQCEQQAQSKRDQAFEGAKSAAAESKG